VTTTPNEIIEFWLDEVGPKRWYDDSAELDNTIRERFMETWEAAQEGKLESWECSREGALALLIVLDQFPRNMFRDDGRSFASDARALALAKKAIGKGFDKQTNLPERIFFYMPMMHSENSVDQEHSVRLIKMNMGETAYLKHARVHREVIRKFGRFPYRNDALGRRTTDDEANYLANGGYASSVREFAG
jgi:uncharacterized protein (DUF924 family)